MIVTQGLTGHLAVSGDIFLTLREIGLPATGTSCMKGRMAAALLQGTGWPLSPD